MKKDKGFTPTPKIFGVSSQGERGFIGLLILLIVALALLKYFLDWSIFDAVESERGQATINYLREVLDVSWSYMRTPVMFVWDRIVELVKSR
ncbi:MAG: hypothetical protein WAX80_02775 [Minisyncoccia bacterium]